MTKVNVWNYYKKDNIIDLLLKPNGIIKVQDLIVYFEFR